MKPAPQDIQFTQGDSFDLFFRLKKRVDETTWDYVDLTGATVKAQIRQTAAASSVDAEFAVTLSNQATTKGGCLLHLSAVLSEALPTGNRVWDCQITFANGDVKTVMGGKVTVNEQVTR